ncbi:MAG: hypothetical protein HYZ14_11110 [Bacteroidetes bacterium]|nr:hypothetical protein [Bacteroidota bacterium]
MKSRKFFMAFAMAFSSLIASAQGSGKVNLRADILTANEQQNMQVSVINLASKDLLQREEVSTRFFYALPLDGRYMLHFKKEGHPATRLIVDTNTPYDISYNVHFALDLKNLDPTMETGISLSAGTIVFDEVSGGFVLRAPESGKATLAAITYSAAASEVAKF